VDFYQTKSVAVLQGKPWMLLESLVLLVQFISMDTMMQARIRMFVIHAQHQTVALGSMHSILIYVTDHAINLRLSVRIVSLVLRANTELDVVDIKRAVAYNVNDADTHIIESIVQVTIQAHVYSALTVE